MNRQHPSGLDLRCVAPCGRATDRTRFDRFLYLGTDIPAVSSDESGRA
jgi:hypothetical protein